MTHTPFPQTIYEGYIHEGRDGWTPWADAYSEDLGICAFAVADEAYTEEWVVRRTDHNPETGLIEVSHYVGYREAATAAEEYAVEMGFTIPLTCRSGEYDTKAEIEAQDADDWYSARSMDMETNG